MMVQGGPQLQKGAHQQSQREGLLFVETSRVDSFTFSCPQMFDSTSVMERRWRAALLCLSVFRQTVGSTLISQERHMPYVRLAKRMVKFACIQPFAQQIFLFILQLAT